MAKNVKKTDNRIKIEKHLRRYLGNDDWDPEYFICTHYGKEALEEHKTNCEEYFVSAFWKCFEIFEKMEMPKLVGNWECYMIDLFSDFIYGLYRKIAYMESFREKDGTESLVCFPMEPLVPLTEHLYVDVCNEVLKYEPGWYEHLKERATQSDDPDELKYVHTPVTEWL